jgi:SAM-dependent methyltransferase
LKSGDQTALTWEEAVLWLRSQPDQAALVKACFFDDPLPEAADRYYTSSEWLAVRELIGRARGRALDVGSGRGIAAVALSRDGWETTALEPNPSEIVGAGAIRSLAQDSRLRIDVVETSAEALPFREESFDLVHVRQALHHAHDLRRFCAEISRVLKPGARMIATREHVLSRRGDLDDFLETHALHHLYGGEFAYVLDEYRKAITDAGITLTKVLNPWASDINLYPDTRATLKEAYARRLGFPLLRMLPDIFLTWGGEFLRIPGRLYTFVGIKRR